MANSYPANLRTAADKLLESQSKEGGWGLITTAVPSIVNTAETLTVLRAAGVPVGEAVENAVRFVARSMPEHTKPRPEGGRGNNTRFVTFGIEGLVTYPQLLDRSDVREGLEWGITWLEQAHKDTLTLLDQSRFRIGQRKSSRKRQPECWVETRGTSEPSFHQTSLVAINLSRLILAKGADSGWGAICERATNMIAYSCRALLRYRRPDGSHPSSLFDASRSSPSKTALVATALAYARDVVGDTDLPWGFGEDSEDTSQRITLADAADSASRWLEIHVEQWKTEIEPDVDVQGTRWEYLAYAQCLRGIAVGRSPDQTLVRKRLRYLNSRWDEEYGLWTEPNKGQPTIRAAYHTVWAEESYAPHSGLVFPSKTPPRIEDKARAGLHFTLLPADRCIRIRETAAIARLSQAQFGIVQLLLESKKASSELSSAVGISEGSVAQTVKRLNQKIKDLSRETQDLVVSESVVGTDGRKAYFWRLSDYWESADG